MNHIHIIPGMSAIMISSSLVSGDSLLTCAVAPAHTQEAANSFEGDLVEKPTQDK